MQQCLYYYRLLYMLQGMSLLKMQSDQELHLYEKTTGFNRLVNQMTATSELIVAKDKVAIIVHSLGYNPSTFGWYKGFTLTLETPISCQDNKSGWQERALWRGHTMCDSSSPSPPRCVILTYNKGGDPAPL